MDEFGAMYWEWILSRMRGHNHKELFEVLHNIQFTYVPDVPMDSARETDGRYLRLLFEDESGIDMPSDALSYPASFLEVLIALADTIEDSIMYSPGTVSDSSRWFWMMLNNIGIDECDDYWFKSTFDGASFVKNRVDDVMLRRYSFNGRGGLFPLNKTEKDQRKIELWYQMNAYVIEQGWI